VIGSGRAAWRFVTATVVALGVVTAVAVAGAPLAAHAQTAPPSLVLVAQDAWTPNGGVVSLRVRTSDVSPGLQLALTTHDQVRSRNRFDETTDGGDLGPTLGRLQVPLDDVPFDAASGTRVLVVPLEQLNARLNLRQSGSGVFPLEVDLRTPDDQSVSRFVTHLVVADVDPAGALTVGRPLDLSWVWPLSADPAYLPDGSPDPAVVEELLPTGRLGRQASYIGGTTDVPLTLAPSPETLDAWTSLAAHDLDLGAGVSEVTSARPRHQVLSGPFVPLDLPSLLANGFAGTIPDELARGASTLEQLVGPIDPSTALPGPLDGASLAALRGAQVRRLVVDGSALTRFDEQFTSARPFTLQPAPADESTATTVLASDVGLQRFLVGDGPAALRAAHLLAGLAVIAGEQPNQPRGIAIVNPARWDAPAELVTPLLAGLRANPLVRPVTVDQLFSEVPPATEGDAPDAPRIIRTLEPYSPPAPPVTPSRFYKALVESEAVASLFPATDARVQRGNRALLASLSSAWADPEGRRAATALLKGIGASVDGYLSRIHVPVRSTVTFTSNAADLPISFDNDTGQPVRVRVRLESNRLLFPEGSERVVELPPRNHTERIRVETRSPGTFPVTVVVETEDGLPIQTTRISVRSSVVSGVGVVLMIGAALFLAAWWGWDIHRRRRDQRGDPALRSGPEPPRDDAPRGSVPSPA
jgi:hypothetical protein